MVLASSGTNVGVGGAGVLDGAGAVGSCTGVADGSCTGVADAAALVVGAAVAIRGAAVAATPEGTLSHAASANTMQQAPIKIFETKIKYIVTSLYMLCHSIKRVAPAVWWGAHKKAMRKSFISTAIGPTQARGLEGRRPSENLFF